MTDTDYNAIMDRLDRIEKLVQQPQKINGITGLAEFLGCSTKSAFKLKESGKLTIRRVGRKLIFLDTEVLEAIKETNNHKKARL